MIILTTDYNDSGNILGEECRREWQEIAETLTQLPLHLKNSDQSGRVGTAIFNPVGTNESIKTELLRRGWASNLPIDKEYDFLGTDIDFEKHGVICEVQFSNYPFLLNNLLRSELFFKAGVIFGTVPVRAAIIVTKAHILPASNSTLYYEQAARQLDALGRYHIFEVPIRLVGLSIQQGEEATAIWTTYHAARYSRTAVQQEEANVFVNEPTSARGRSRIDRL